MATQYSAQHFIPRLDVVELVLRTHAVMQSHGITLDARPAVWIDDQELDEPLPEFIADGIETAAQYISQWPGAGSLQYTLWHPSEDTRSPGYVLHTYFQSYAQLSVLSFAFPGGAFRPGSYPGSLPAVTQLVEALHEEFLAYRSGFGWGLAELLSEETRQVDLIAQGIIAPCPLGWLDIIDPALATPDVLAGYQAARREGSILRRTGNGSLLWQLDAGPP